MGGGGQAMKRIPLIKFPQRHPKPPASGSTQIQAAEKERDAQQTMSDVPPGPINIAVGGKASLQPKRTPVSESEIDSILWVAACDFRMIYQAGKAVFQHFFYKFNPLVYDTGSSMYYSVLTFP